MKKFILAFVALFTIAISASAMSYEQAREQALFLTDKMAYELNLTDEQYEAAYEVNLDYLMNINHHSDLYGVYWQQRNLDLQYILLDWQYRSFLDALYFYRPLYWEAGFWHFRIYARYPHRDYFYFGRPHFYTVYRGGHSWRVNGGRSWYHGRVFVRNSGNRHFGMRDGFSRGDYGNRRIGNRVFGSKRHSEVGFDNNRSRSDSRVFGGSRSTERNNIFGNSSRSTERSNNVFGGSRSSSTRETVGNSRIFGGSRGNSSFGDSRSGSSFGGSRSSSPARTFSPGGGSRSVGGSRSNNSGGGHFGGHR